MKASLALALVMSVTLSQNAFATDAQTASAASNGRPAVLVLTAEQSAKLNSGTVAKPEAKPEAKTAAKPVAKAAVKVAAKPAARPVAKVAAKPVAKPVVKTAAKPKAKTGGSVLRVSTTQLVVGTSAPRKPAAPKSTPMKAHVAKKADAAAEASEACAVKEQTQKKSALACMNKEITQAETRLDSAEVRLFNCAEMRKLQKAGEPSFIDALVRARKNQLVTKAETSLKTELEVAGKIGPRQTREIQLRATLNHLTAVEKLGNKLCSADAFAKMMAK